jgi:hypothetical protein
MTQKAECVVVVALANGPEVPRPLGTSTFSKRAVANKMAKEKSLARDFCMFTLPTITHCYKECPTVLSVDRMKNKAELLVWT